MFRIIDAPASYYGLPFIGELPFLYPAADARMRLEVLDEQLLSAEKFYNDGQLDQALNALLVIDQALRPLEFELAERWIVIAVLLVCAVALIAAAFLIRWHLKKKQRAVTMDEAVAVLKAALRRRGHAHKKHAAM